MSLFTHCSHVLQQLRGQLEYGFLCDCAITIGDVHFRVHRAVLAACSAYFHKLFITQPLTSSVFHLNPKQVRPNDFDLILQMMYTGKTESPITEPENLRAAMLFLKFYNIPEFLGPAAQTGDTLVPSFAGDNQMLYGVEVYNGVKRTEPLGTDANADQKRTGSPEDERPRRRESYMCICGEEFSNPDDCLAHMDSHGKLYCCPKCQEEFYTTEEQEAHIKRCTVGSKPDSRESQNEGNCQDMSDASEEGESGSAPDSEVERTEPSKLRGLKLEPEDPNLLELQGIKVVHVSQETEEMVIDAFPQPRRIAEDYELEAGCGGQTQSPQGALSAPLPGVFEDQTLPRKHRMVELVQGTKVFLYESQLVLAKSSARSPTSLARLLLDVFFTREDQARSNLSGENGLNQLNPRIVNAIMAYSISQGQYPPTKTAVIKTALRNKLGCLRAPSRLRAAVRKESESFRQQAGLKNEPL
uniref:Uncharacterized protein n=2 Tax=Latimeria chalumnae TaxID=7897 RepID=H3ARS8_LATCH|nr:PREDICTED: zinc finger and BTB domain-containing protein 1-like [Latimeria chalumnae]|eukprot:XP_006000501.1 PREDICTED: zinc finger and BTB domain-containing protein 1-like [Latimeria chalumnae]